MFKALKPLCAAAAVAAVFTGGLPASAKALSNEPEDRITVRLVTANGSGCPLGSITAAPFEDNEGFTITYNSFIAQAGGGVSPLENRKNCQIAVEAKVPQGFTYAIAEVTSRGYMQLEKKATGVTKTSYYFAGDPHTADVQKTFKGEETDNWEVTHQAESIIWAPCKTTRNININTELRLRSGSNSTPTSIMTLDSTDTSVSTIFQFSWKRC